MEINFVQWQSEAWLAPPAGAYLAKLNFMDNNRAGKTLASPISAEVSVK